MDYAFCAAIRIACGDCDYGDEDGHDGARSSVRSGGCCATRRNPLNKMFALRVLQLQPPLRPAKHIPLNRIDNRASFAQQKQRSWSIDAD